MIIVIIQIRKCNDNNTHNYYNHHHYNHHYHHHHYNNNNNYRNPEEASRLKQKSIELSLQYENILQRAKILESAKMMPTDNASLWNELQISIESITDVVASSSNHIQGSGVSVYNNNNNDDDI